MIKEDNDFKLMPSPVPDSCWYSNLRAHLPAKVWDLIRKDAYAKANGRCMICNRPVKRLEAHEDWSYDEVNHIQKLERVVAICHSCHSVIHIGRTQLLGDEDKAIVGDFANRFKWGYAKEIAMEVIPYGDPDNTGVDLKGSGQVYIRCQTYLGWGIFDGDSFARVTTA